MMNQVDDAVVAGGILLHYYCCLTIFHYLDAAALLLLLHPNYYSIYAVFELSSIDVLYILGKLPSLLS